MRTMLRLVVFGAGLWCGWEGYRLIALDRCLDAGGRIDAMVCRGAE